jgi:hypothetical protein
MASLAHSSVTGVEDSEDEADWEEVHIDTSEDIQFQQFEFNQEPEKLPLEITVSTRRKVDSRAPKLVLITVYLS